MGGRVGGLLGLATLFSLADSNKFEQLTHDSVRVLFDWKPSVQNK